MCIYSNFENTHYVFTWLKIFFSLLGMVSRDIQNGAYDIPSLAVL